MYSFLFKLSFPSSCAERKNIHCNVYLSPLPQLYFMPHLIPS